MQQTSLNVPPTKRKKPGRKKKRRSFTETRVGYFLSRITPLEYRILLEASGDFAPSADLIERVAYASLHPFFKTPKFRKALIEYRKTGLYPQTVIKPLPDREVRYIHLRQAFEKEIVKSGNF